MKERKWHDAKLRRSATSLLLKHCDAHGPSINSISNALCEGMPGILGKVESLVLATRLFEGASKYSHDPHRVSTAAVKKYVKSNWKSIQYLLYPTGVPSTRVRYEDPAKVPSSEWVHALTSVAEARRIWSKHSRFRCARGMLKLKTNHDLFESCSLLKEGFLASLMGEPDPARVWYLHRELLRKVTVENVERKMRG